MLALWIGKTAELLLRLAGRRATSLPGKIALRFSPRLLWKLGRKLERCIVITGTNGKTTTSALISGIIGKHEPVISNEEGANMEQGLASALIHHVNWFGKLKCKTAVLEIDEATLPMVIDAFPAQIAVVTNVFRDQLDRYGELDTTVDKILTGLKKSEATVLLNGDDPLARHIGLHSGRPVFYFGMSRENVRDSDRTQIRDGAFCLECGAALEYDGFFYGQLGLYRCPQCDFLRPHPDFMGSFSGDSLELMQGDLPKVSFQLPVRGVFNVYNALSAIAAARVYGLNQVQIQSGLMEFHSPLGRMQVYATQPSAILNLIKNPTGCDSVLQAISAEPGEKVLCVAINDLAADGRDVSWLWDADFELVPDSGNFRRCIATGLRAEDMAIRLKYAGYPVDDIDVVPNLEAGIHAAFSASTELGGLPVFVVTTYTALYPAAEILRRRQATDDENPQYRASVS